MIKNNLAMTDIYLHNVDPCEIEDVLLKVETSFNIKIQEGGLNDITTFGELCDCIISKIQLDDSEGCTSQQAFYKLRQALALVVAIDAKSILPESELSLPILVVLVGLQWLARVMGNEFDLKTVGQLAKKIGRENYLQSRRNPNSINRQEVERVITELFSADLDLDESKLTREASLSWGS